MVPYDLMKSPDASSQPLIEADRSATHFDSPPSPAPSSESKEEPSSGSTFYDDDSDVPTEQYDDDDSDAPSDIMHDTSRRFPHQPKAGGSNVNIRSKEELSILTSLPQNKVPYTLIEMRSLYTHGKKRGKITKNSKKGKPWSVVWHEQMSRCAGVGAWGSEEMHEELKPVAGKRRLEGRNERLEVERDGAEEDIIDHDSGSHDDEEAEDGDGDADVDSGRKGLMCSPFTVIYGHAGKS